MQGYHRLILTFCELRNFSKSTREIYIRHLGALAVRDPEEPLRIENILAYLHGLKPHSKKRAWACFDRFCSWLLISGELKASPMAHIPRPSANTRPGKGLTRDGLARLLQAVSDGLNTSDPVHYFGALRLSILVKLCLYYGLRTGEVLGVRDRDLDLARQKLWVVRKGNYRDLTVQLHQDVTDELFRFKALSQGRREGLHDYVFITWRGSHCSHHTIYRQVEKLGARAGVDLVTNGLHQLRHTMAGIMLEDGLELSEISSYLGHYSMSSTDYYLRSHFGKKTQRGRDIVQGIVDASKRDEERGTADVVPLREKGRDDDVPF